MPLKNQYDVCDGDAGFDIEMLHNGEIAVEIHSFRERNAKGDDIIELGCKIVWSAQDADQERVGEEFKHTLFFNQKSGVTIKILKDVLRKAGFQVNGWVKDSETPLSLMLPSALKLLAWKRAVLIGKVTRSTNDQGTRAFFNLVKLAREVPGTGEPYPDALPNPVPNALVLEAYHVDGLEGEDFNYGANAGGKDNIPV